MESKHHFRFQDVLYTGKEFQGRVLIVSSCIRICILYSLFVASSIKSDRVISLRLLRTLGRGRPIMMLGFSTQDRGALYLFPSAHYDP